jgi:diguanylate cyclase (GGDEF)-like protein/PAS domain S-box-containing protein
MNLSKIRSVFSQLKIIRFNWYIFLLLIFCLSAYCVQSFTDLKTLSQTKDNLSEKAALIQRQQTLKEIVTILANECLDEVCNQNQYSEDFFRKIQTVVSTYESSKLFDPKIYSDSNDLGALFNMLKLHRAPTVDSEKSNSQRREDIRFTARSALSFIDVQSQKIDSAIRAQDVDLVPLTSNVLRFTLAFVENVTSENVDKKEPLRISVAGQNQIEQQKLVKRQLVDIRLFQSAFGNRVDDEIQFRLDEYSKNLGLLSNSISSQESAQLRDSYLVLANIKGIRIMKLNLSLLDFLISHNLTQYFESSQRLEERILLQKVLLTVLIIFCIILSLASLFFGLRETAILQNRYFVMGLLNSLGRIYENSNQANNLVAAECSRLIEDFRRATEQLTFLVDRKERELESLRKSVETRTDLFHRLVSNNTDLISHLDEALRYTYVNPALCRVTGITEEEFIGKTRHELDLKIKDFENKAEFTKGVFGSAGPTKFEFEMDTVVGMRVFEGNFVPEKNESGESIGLLTVCRDITEKVIIQTEFKKYSDQIAQLLRLLPIAVFIIEKNHVTIWNNEAQRILEWPHEIGQYTCGIPLNLAFAGMPAEWNLLFDRELDKKVEFIKHRKDGTPMFLSAFISSISNNEAGSGLMMTLQDVSDQKYQEKKIYALDNFDPLTNLVNRARFTQILQSEVARNRSTSCGLGLLIMDLDRFQLVNEAGGHAFGDSLIENLAGRLRETCNDAISIARIGGDEFAALIEIGSDYHMTARCAQNVVRSFSAAFSIGTQICHPSISIGIANFPVDAETSIELLKLAELAMYEKKENGGNGYQFSSPAFQVTSLARTKMELALRESVTDFSQFELHFQPKIELTTGKIHSFEALLRWQHPDLGMVSPTDFIPVAEQTGLILPIGIWVLREACVKAKTLGKNGVVQKVAVNLSVKQFQDPSLYRNILDIAKKCGVSPSVLELEITESILMDDIEQARKTLAKLKAVGISISIDDFGTGYSSLSYLKVLPIDTIKIDRSFISSIPNSSEDMLIVQAIIELGHRLGLSIVAEGVENLTQRQFLLENNCDIVQGYLFSEPLSPDELETYLTKFDNS